MRRGPHPFVFFLLILPYGASFGYVTVALNYIAVEKSHVGVDVFAKIVAAAFFVHGIKFLWAPIVDKTLTKRTWYLIALGLTVAGTLVSSLMPLTPAAMPALTGVVVASQLGLTLMGFSCENFLGNLPEDHKGRASGWYQAGTFVGLGLGGDLALELSGKLAHGWMVGAIMGLIMLPSALGLLWIEEPAAHEGTVFDSMKQLGRDLLGMVFEEVRLRPIRIVLSLTGITGLLISLSPVGSGAAGNLWASIAHDWNASETMVARVTGSAGGVISGLGALGGGWLADRMSRRLAYALAGVATALSAFAMAVGPRTDWSYAAFTLIYSFFNGVAYAAFSAFVLETIGRGAVATKYNIFASLANLAVGYMTRIDSAAYKDGGSLVALPGGACRSGGTACMLYADGLYTLGGCLALMGVIVLMRQFRRTAPVVPDAPAT